MPGILDQIVLRDFVVQDLELFSQPCRQRILVVTDGFLNFNSSDGFGLSRLVAALRTYSPQPIITLAHRNLGNHNVTIGGVVFAVIGNFNFATAAVTVNTANYDQVWFFGFKSGPVTGNQNNVHPLTGAEINRLGTFMNNGGGVFATGDHATLGQGMGGELPRIRRMRDWSSVPMGTEGNATARDRIDTVVDPGPGGLYEFDDQGDSIPQRIYPNYRVTWTTTWTATIHPLLRMPGTPANRTNASGFTNDMDVLPDHPHESICREISATVNASQLNATYNAHGLNFQEFPNLASGSGRVGSEIVAFGVSGGRSVNNSGIWKPPVNPRMFGLISAFDGHAALSYAGAPTRPGRIVCDSTWHHYVNVNIDGFGTVHSGLGTGFGAGWTPSAAGQKVFQYYRNIIAYLIPLNRRNCWLFAELLAIRLHPFLIEELVLVEDFRSPFEFEGLGNEAIRLLDSVHGKGAAVEAVRSALRLDGGTIPLADAAEGDLLIRSDGEASPIVAYTLGKTLSALAQTLPVGQPEQLRKVLKKKGHEAIEAEIGHTIAAAAAEAVELQIERADARREQLISCSPRRRNPRPY